MDTALVRHFIEDARQACQDCNKVLALSSTGSDLAQLLQAARRGTIERRGKVAVPGRRVYEYHVHGAGYSFKELPSGKEIHFDVVPVDGVHRIRFSAFSIVRYASSIGIESSPEAAQSLLDKLSEEDSCIVHVIDGPFNYFYWTDE
jgi:hypothetical protein